MHVSSSTTAPAAASFYSQNPAIAACSALTGQYPAHRFKLASHRHAIRADGRNKARGPLIGTDGTAKGWLRIAAMTMEILFRRSILPGTAFPRLDRFAYRLKSPDQPLVIGLALNVGGCRRFRSMDAVEDPQPYEHKETADTIERSPPKTTHRFEHRVV